MPLILSISRMGSLPLDKGRMARAFSCPCIWSRRHLISSLCIWIILSVSSSRFKRWRPGLSWRSGEGPRWKKKSKVNKSDRQLFLGGQKSRKVLQYLETQEKIVKNTDAAIYEMIQEVCLHYLINCIDWLLTNCSFLASGMLVLVAFQNIPLYIL